MINQVLIEYCMIFYDEIMSKWVLWGSRFNQGWKESDRSFKVWINMKFDFIV